MNKSKYLFFALLVSLVLVPVGFSYAVEPSSEASTAPEATIATSPVVGTATPDPAANFSARDQVKAASDARKSVLATQKAALAQKREALGDARCTAVTSKIAIQVTRFEAKMLERGTFFNRFSKRVASFIIKMDEAGYDTAKLKADQIILDQKIAQFATDKVAYIVLLKESQSYTCGKSEGEFRSKLLDAKEALTTARLSNQDVRSYYQSVIRPDIAALKVQVRASKTSTPNTGIEVTPTIAP